MSSKTENSQPSSMGSLYLLIAIVMLVGGIGAYYYYQDLAITPVRVAGLIAVAVLASWVAAQSTQGAAFFRFLREADIERRKVVWPSHQEALQTSLMVIVVIILISLFLAGVDWMLGALIRALLSGGG
jgi:preprotein translocase subunit SecE